MQFTAAQIAMMIQGTVEGDPGVKVNSFGKIEDAKNGQLSFLANPKYEDFLYSTSASIIIINQNLALKQPVQATLIKVPDAYSAFAQLLSAYQDPDVQTTQRNPGTSHIPASTKLGENVFIGAFSYIGETWEIGDNVKIYPRFL
jgi:UDP-3-O-[3-hydroxymyristoyl] glucosamine N-acyltransferase